MIIEKFGLNAPDIGLDIVSRTTGSKSKLMTEINQLRSKIANKLLEENYISKDTDISLIKGPDLRSKGKNRDGTQYWSFSYAIELKEIKAKKAKKRATKNSHTPNI
jgi:hypothetical protein